MKKLISAAASLAMAASMVGSAVPFITGAADSSKALEIRAFKDVNGKEMKMMSFYAPEEYLGAENGDLVRVQFTLTKNEFRGKVAIEGNIISLEIREKL